MTGHNIFATGGSIIVSDSDVSGSFNRGESADPAAEEALSAVGRVIRESGNKSAEVLFEELKRELKNPKRDRATLRGYWNSVIQLVPDISKIADATAKIADLFN